MRLAIRFTPGSQPRVAPAQKQSLTESKQHLAPGSQVLSDGLVCFRDVTTLGQHRQWVWSNALSPLGVHRSVALTEPPSTTSGHGDAGGGQWCSSGSRSGSCCPAFRSSGGVSMARDRSASVSAVGRRANLAVVAEVPLLAGFEHQVEPLLFCAVFVLC